MVRSILRSVQNSLIVGALVLCVLAFQRLETLDVSHKQTSQPSSLWPYPPPYTERFSEDEKEEEHQDVSRLLPAALQVFARRVRKGLVRLALPAKLQPTSIMAPPSWTASYTQTSSGSVPATKNLRASVAAKQVDDSLTTRQNGERAAILVEIDDCNENTLDAATILEQSLPRDSGIQLYALVIHNEKEALTKCEKDLAGYEVVKLSQVIPVDVSMSCLNSNEATLLYAHTLEADVAYNIPLPSLAVPVKGMEFTNSTSDARVSKKAITRDAQNKDASILMTRPQGKGFVEQYLKDLIANHCNKEASPKQPLQPRTQPRVEMQGIAPWRPCETLDANGHCVIAKDLSIASFADCPMPWMEDATHDETANQSECGALRQKWRQAMEVRLHSK